MKYINVHNFVYVNSLEGLYKAYYIGNVYYIIILIIFIMEGIVLSKLLAGVILISFTFTATFRSDTFLYILMRSERVLFKRSKVLPLI